MSQHIKPKHIDYHIRHKHILHMEEYTPLFGLFQYWSSIFYVQGLLLVVSPTCQYSLLLQINVGDEYEPGKVTVSIFVANGF